MKPENVSRIEQKIGYVFKDKKLLKVCFSHSSYTNEHGGENNERLEFLGDALLGAFVADFLFQTTRDNEGKMTEKRKALVAAAPLKTAIERMGLQKFILAGGDGQNVGEKAISSLERPHICTHCGKRLLEPLKPIYFSHIKSKGAYPELRLVKSNIELTCEDCHTKYEFGARSSVCKDE